MSETVEPAEWLSHHAALVGRGFAVLDLFSVRCEGDQFVVTTRVLTETVTEGHFSQTRVVANEELESLTPVFPAARWHEREAFELFGIAIEGVQEMDVLMWDPADGPSPLAPSTVLRRRLVDWPGEYEPGPPKRRKKATPGVRSEWLRDD